MGRSPTGKLTMLIIAVLNAKGGCGKTMIATHIAALCAREGKRVALCDLDAQKSARRWLERRPRDAASIERAKLKKDGLRVATGVTRVVIDGAAAMDRAEAKELIARADVIVVPVLPSMADREATETLLERLASLKRLRKGQRALAFVANRYRRGTKAAGALDDFLAQQQWPVVGRLRDTQLYTNAAERGLSVFELRESRARSYAAEWQDLADFLDRQASD